MFDAAFQELDVNRDGRVPLASFLSSQREWISELAMQWGEGPLAEALTALFREVLSDKTEAVRAVTHTMAQEALQLVNADHFKEEMATAMYDYKGEVRGDELLFSAGDRIVVTDRSDAMGLGWWKGKSVAVGWKESCQEGWFPASYVKIGVVIIT